MQIYSFIFWLLAGTPKSEFERDFSQGGFMGLKAPPWLMALSLSRRRHNFSQCSGQKSCMCVCSISTHTITDTHTHTHTREPYNHIPHTVVYIFCVLCRSAALVARYVDWILCRPHKKVVRTHTQLTHTIKALAMAAE